MRRFLAVVLCVSSSLAFAAAPKCADRVKSLKSLGEQADARARDDANGVVQLSYPSSDSIIERLDSREGWKTRGVRLMANPQAQFFEGEQEALVKHLLALAKETKVEVCVQLEGPIEKKLSADADAKLLAPMLKTAGSVGVMDRATVIASELTTKKGKCKGIVQLVNAVSNAAPADRLPILLTGAAEALEECKCPAADAERVYAALTLMADVWDAKTNCSALTIGKPGTAKPVVMTGTLVDFVTRLSAAGEAGVELKAK